jgi:phage-related holin
MEYNVKSKIALSSLITPLIAFYEPITALIVPILWLVLIDIVTGMYATRIVERKPLTSRGFFKKLPQVAMFIIAISASLHADPFFTQLGIEQFQSAKLVISFYGLYELFSILENLGRSGLPIARQFSRILQAKLPEEIKQELPAKQE